MKVLDSNFKTSVNVKFDLGKKEFVKRYLPTPSHAESLLGLLQGFNSKKSLKSHMIIGPYGTGKSLIATIVGGLVSKKIDNSTFNVLVRKYEKVHEGIYTELNKIKDNDITYLTVALNGNEGRFRYAILDSIIRTLNENKVDIILPGQYGKIIQTIDLWKQEFPQTYREFKKKLKEEKKDLQLWRLEILNRNKDEIEWFMQVYPTLSAGAEFFIDFKEDFIGQLSFVLQELKKLNIGLFIVYDEFGRMLQTLDSLQVHETMQDIQDMAELIDHTSLNLHFLLITHKNLSQYFNLLNDEYKKEFNRIEKRFRSYYVESDSSTFLRIAESFIQDGYPTKVVNNGIEKIVNSLRKYPLFPELNQQEIEKIVIEGTYPIHPVTLFLLPYLSSAFGQNQRTLFTFLESNETSGLQNHMNKTGKYYLPSELFEYFFPAIHNIDTSNEDFRELKIYKKIINKTPEINNDKEKSSILKLITLWQLAGLNSKFKLDSEFLEFSLGIRNKVLGQLLLDLSMIKAIRYNRVLGYWELMEGSSFFLDELIKDKLPTISYNNRNKIVVLDKCLAKKFYLSNDYNDTKSMTRYAEVQFIFSSEILDTTIDYEELRNSKNSDMIVFYILLESQQDYEKLLSNPHLMNNDYCLFCISNNLFTSIELQTLEYLAIENLLLDQELMSQDKNLKDELNLKKEDLVFIFNDFLNTYYSYDNKTTWLYKNRVINIESEIGLEKILSQTMFEKYPNTIEVRNDSFNRRKINNTQRNAGYKVLDHIINDYSKQDIGIEGQGPDYLIYATIFKNNKFYPNSLDKIQSDDIKKLRKELINYLEQNNSGNLIDFVKIMSNEPFGIREPLIPIFLVSLLRDKWDQLMFYRNDMYVSGINGEKLYKMVEEASEYSFVYYNFKEEFEEFFVGIERMFNEFENGLVKNKPRIIRINNAILTWLRNLPRVTQITDNLNSDLLWLKNNIKKSEINPQESLTELYSRYSNNLSELKNHRLQLESYFNEFKLDLKKFILTLFNVNSFEELYKRVKEQTPEIKKKNKLANSIIKINDKHKWIDAFAISFLGIEIEAWSDTTTEMFKRQLKVEFDSIKQTDQINDKNIQIIYNGNVKYINTVELSTKSQTIYNNVSRMINNAGRNVPKEEVEYMIYKLMEDFVE
ncbi:hypothetical protein [Metabacillus dongyingensis]|uniref:hypothetical protein n=1 Tax=Metabacillus dongyingensis TaxID=2874282 RepID=UPI001CBDA70E|nr:hypothetical protein [Metabacillus dongyingensis]UAL53609.1 hypothetical protein K8L98_07445 [Metabacillus dongyingensis]